jgi:hypothetical protein
VRKIVTAEHRFGVRLERIEITRRVGAVKAAAAHASVRVVRILGLLFQDDDLGPEIRCLDRSTPACGAEADDDDVRFVFGGFVQFHVPVTPQVA